MQVEITAESDAMAAQVGQMLDFYLTGEMGELERIEITLQVDRRRSGGQLFSCQLRASPRRGRPILVDETQAELTLSVNRSLARCARTLQRRQQQHFATMRLA